MSASEAAALYPARAGKPPGEGRSLLALVERVTPKQGWDSFLLLFGIVGVVALTMRQAEWVETPGLIPIVAWSCLAGLVFAKTRGPWPLLFVAGLAVGFVVVIWQASSLVEGQTLADRTGELWTRLGARYEAATTGGISVDLLPFTLGVLSLAWLLGFLSAWLLFRVTHIWLGLVLAGTAMLTNLSFLPSGNEPRFFLFMLFAMLLVARVSALQRQDQWRSTRFRTASISRSVAIPAAAGISVVVLIIASGLPLNVYVSYAAARLWNQARSPVASMEHEFARLFSGIPSRKDLSGRFFGKTLPFQGKISPGSDVVLLANSNHPSYWLSRTYSQYTSEGWIAGETESLRVGPESLPPPRQESFKREAVFQRLQPTFDTVTVLSGGNVDWINREAVVETLAPLEFEVDLRDLSNNSHLPEDIQGLATELKRVSSPPPAGFVESHIYKMIPLDLVLTGVFPRGDDATGTAPEKITLARKQPNLPDVVSWRLVETLKADYYYSMRTFVSRATDDDLRAAGTKYSGFIKDHYLQLPTTLPQRVRDLAIALTQSAETPLDKTLVVQDLLRGSNFEYSQDIDKPPRGADGVDHFLFETRTGYSDYFASSMAVLLRAAGVPARQAAGYAPGELDELGRRVVMDSDSHGWTQVYFPGHGWIDFEPTPVWPVPRRGGFTENESGSDSNNGLSTDSPDCLQDPDLAAFACEDGEAEIAEETDLEQLLLEAGISGGALEEAGGSPRSLTLPVALALIVVAGTPALGWFILTWGLGKATPSERAYSKMSRLGTLAGIRRQSHQTPAEYAGNIGNAIPAIASGSQELAGAFAAGRYSGREQGEGEGELLGLSEAWKSVRGGLLSRALRRLILLGRV